MEKRAVSYPLIVCDPFFSVWSPYNAPYEGSTEHWTGEKMPIEICLNTDGKLYRLVGNPGGIPEMPMQKAVVTPLRTVYTFSKDGNAIEISFFTPAFLDRMETVTLPISFISYRFLSGCKDATVEMRLSPAFVTSDRVSSARLYEEQGAAVAEASPDCPLSRSGDYVRAGWGRLHLLHRNAKVISGTFAEKDAPWLIAGSDKTEDHFTVAYDDEKSMRFLGKELNAYWKLKYKCFDDMLKAESGKYSEYLEKAVAFDRELLRSAESVSPEYADLISMSYRQCIGAHKLVEYNGKPMLISKENSSNGCGATLDVTYPSIPIFLKFNPELVRAMLRPLLLFAKSEYWPFPFAPHDCGQFPLLDKQVYGLNEDGTYDFNSQMPVEECGNAILCLTSSVLADGNTEMAKEYEPLIRSWVEYLIENGYCPANQLCTDDFAGHLAHNCNLSIKAIVAIAAASKLYRDDEYRQVAEGMAKSFVSDAKGDGYGTRLTFDDATGWSLKYNAIWDKLLSLGLFDESFYKGEGKRYEAEMNQYGTPLDCRKDYTKLDWLVWSAAMCGGSYERETYRRIEAMICETKDRHPLTDWYDTVTAANVSFRARTVVGGVFISLLSAEDFAG